MSNIPTSTFEAWPHDEIQGEQVDTERLPFSDDFFRSHFDAGVTVAVDGSLPYIKTGPTHNRSYELAVGKVGTEHVIANALWEDKYGNRYTTLSTKGNNFNEQKVLRSLTAPSGYIPYGLQEGDALLRVLTASRVMREAGIDTEWIVRILEPKSLQFEHERVDQATFKRKLLEKIIVNGLNDDEEPASADEVHTIASALEEMSFYVTLRAMSISDRPFDFNGDDSEQVMSRLAKIFEVHNLRNTEPEIVLDINNPRHVEFYFTGFLPINLGDNLAKLHNLGLVHDFPYAGNVNCLGGIVDLDSVKGQALGLGEEPVSLENFMTDIRTVIEHDDPHDFTALFEHLHKIGILKSPDCFNLFGQRFLSSYLHERNLDPNKPEGSKEILMIAEKLKQVPVDQDSLEIISAAFSTLHGDLFDLVELTKEEHYKFVFASVLKEMIDSKRIPRVVDSQYYEVGKNPRFFSGEVSDQDIKQIIFNETVSGMGIVFQDAYQRCLLESRFGTVELENSEEIARAMAVGFNVTSLEQLSKFVEAQELMHEVIEACIEEYRDIQKTRDDISDLLDLKDVGLSDEKQIYENGFCDERVTKLKSQVKYPELSNVLGRKISSFTICNSDAYHNFTSDRPAIFVSDSRLYSVGRGEFPNHDGCGEARIGGFYVLTDPDETPTYLAILSEANAPGMLDVTIYSNMKSIEALLETK